MSKNWVFLLCLSLSATCFAQNDFYATDSVQEIRIYFNQNNWADLLDTLFLAGEGDRLVGDIEINGTRLEQVGVRYKGFSSYSSARVKNPFNIKLNFIRAGQRYDGIDKIKLSNVIQDPSFIREALSYEIARDYMPASRANFARVFVNDVYLGLYTNVEAVNNEFTERQFGTQNGSFIKGNPNEVELNGENANLSNSPGTDSTDYFPLYKLESTYGWNDLLRLIDGLNNTPDSIQNLLNVDRALWMHAFNMVLVNFDSYVGYAQNYYLYMDRNGRWNTIPWDLNMSFASYRLTDASTYFNGFNIAQAKTYNPLSHHTNFLVHPRPLFTALSQNASYRRMYMAHIKTIVEDWFASGNYLTYANTIQGLIASDVLADTNKFYSDDMFFDNLDSTVSDLIDYPGIRDLMESRTAYLQSNPSYNLAPTIAAYNVTNPSFEAGDQVDIQVPIANGDSAFIAYRSDEDDLFVHLELRDDGMHNDGAANDGLWGASLFPEANYIEFYFYAENDSAGAFSPTRAAFEYHTLLSPVLSNGIVINELMAANENRVEDNDGEFEDWIELLNTSTKPISTAGLFLSDNETDSLKWALPLRIIEPGEYLIIWADDENTGRHTNFKLNDAGEQLWLNYSDGNTVDKTSFERQYPISSWGRYPNASGPFRELVPSFGSRNRFAEEEQLNNEVHLYPNPGREVVNIIHRGSRPLSVSVYRSDGQLIDLIKPSYQDGVIQLNTAVLAAGSYIAELTNNDGTVRRPFQVIE